MRYFAYARRSQDRDERQAQSIEDQTRFNRELVERKGFAVVDEINESASAKEPFKQDGSTPARSEFAAMIERIRRGEAEGIIAWHPDRLSRNETDAATIIWLLRHGKIKDLQFYTYAFQNSPEGILMLQGALSQSQYVSSKLSVDVSRGLKSKVEKGWRPNPVPPGYLNRADASDPARTPIVVSDTERWEPLRRFWELIMTGAYMVPSALHVLNDEWGFRTRPTEHQGGGPLSRASAYALLKNPFYTGQIVLHGITYPGKHPTMVTPEEFDLVQAILRRQRKQRYRKYAFAYTGLMRCRNCGAQVTAGVHKRSSKHGPYHYYYCSNSKGSCQRVGISEDDLEQQIAKILERVTIDDDVRQCVEQAMGDWQTVALPKSQTIPTEQQLSINKLEAQLDRLLTLQLQDGISIERFKTKQSELEGQLSKLQLAHEEAGVELERTKQSAENTLMYRATALERFRVGTAEEKRQIVTALGTRYLFDRGTLSIELHPSLSLHLTVEPLDSADLSTKSASKPQAILTGRPSKSQSKALYRFFSTQPSFPVVSCLFR